jgi:hypothetical protein
MGPRFPAAKTLVVSDPSELLDDGFASSFRWLSPQ